MNPKTVPSSQHTTRRVRNSIHRKLDQGFDPETEGDDIYEQIEEIDPDELLNDFGSEDDEDDLY